VLVDLGELFLEEGRLDEAAAHLEPALAIHREAGNRKFEGITLGRIGRLVAERGRIEESRACFDAGAQLLREVSSPAELGELLAARAVVERGAGAFDVARRALDEAEALASSMNSPPSSNLGGAITRARAALDRSIER
jgi:tetratricopeptide (TPR) repeat protein